MTNSITITGNLTADPELRHTPSGQAVANFTIADTPRTFNRQTNEWVDGETVFLPCAVWREYAENVVASLTKGARVTAAGKLKSRSFETKEGEKRTVLELDVEEIGPALKHATAVVKRTPREGQGGSGPSQNAGGQGGSWGGSGSSAQSGGGWGDQGGASSAGGGWGNGSGY
jgi:single-strand DNA-binding protein